MDSEIVNTLAIEIMAGVDRGDSRFRDEPGFDDEWDSLVADIEAINGMVMIPPEIE